MYAGKMDRRLILQQRQTSQNANGEEIESFSTLATVWGGKRDVRGDERFASSQVLAEETVTFFIRWRNDVTRRDRVICDGKTYNIKHVAEIGRRRGLEITATAKVD